MCTIRSPLHHRRKEPFQPRGRGRDQTRCGRGEDRVGRGGRRIDSRPIAPGPNRRYNQAACSEIWPWRSAFSSPRSRRGPPPATAVLPAPHLALPPTPPAEPPLGLPHTTDTRLRNVRRVPGPPLERSHGARRPGGHSRPAIPAHQPERPREHAMDTLWITSSH